MAFINWHACITLRSLTMVLLLFAAHWILVELWTGPRERESCHSDCSHAGFLPGYTDCQGNKHSLTQTKSCMFVFPQFSHPETPQISVLKKGELQLECKCSLALPIFIHSRLLNHPVSADAFRPWLKLIWHCEPFFCFCASFCRTWFLSTTLELCWVDCLHDVLTLALLYALLLWTAYTLCFTYSYAMKVQTHRALTFYLCQSFFFF